MQGVVLAAGEGTRMRPLTASKPKGLVEVAGKPLLTHCFETLVDLGVEELVVVVGYRKEDVVEHYGDAFDGVSITYAHQEDRLGLAHALRSAADAVDDDFLLMNGDNVCDANLRDVVERHRETDAACTAFVEEVSRDRATEGAVYELEDGEITGLVEKPDDPPSRLVPRGFYAFSPLIFHACRLITPSDRGEYELPDAVDLLLAAGRPVETVPFEGWCLNVNTPADRERAAELLEESRPEG